MNELGSLIGPLLGMAGVVVGSLSTTFFEGDDVSKNIHRLFLRSGCTLTKL